MLRPEGHPLVAAFLDPVMAPMARFRERLLPLARGEVLEIGAGTGANLDYFDAARVTRLVAVEPDPHMRRRAEVRFGQARFPVALVDAAAEALPFGDASFDTVVFTWVLCTIPDPLAAAREARRVLRSDGQLLFAEHTLARHAGPRAVQRAITPVWKHVAGGCHLDRDSLPLLEQAGFVLEAHAPRRDRFALVPTWWGTARPAP